jgi:hypothetical protein
MVWVHFSPWVKTVCQKRLSLSNSHLIFRPFNDRDGCDRESTKYWFSNESSLKK